MLILIVFCCCYSPYHHHVSVNASVVSSSVLIDSISADLPPSARLHGVPAAAVRVRPVGILHGVVGAVPQRHACV